MVNTDGLFIFCSQIPQNEMRFHILIQCLLFHKNKVVLMLNFCRSIHELQSLNNTKGTFPWLLKETLFLAFKVVLNAERNLESLLKVSELDIEK